MTRNCEGCGLGPLCARAGRSRAGRLGVQQGTLAPGEALYRAGRPSSAFYALRSGCIKDVVTRPNGAEAVVQFALPGEVVGLGTLGGDRAPTTAVAVTASRYCRVPAAAVQRLAREAPEAGRELVRLLAQTVGATQAFVAALLDRDALSRVAACLVDISARLERAGLDGERFRLGLSRRELASHLGLTLETVSRALGELAHRGLIHVRAKEFRLLLRRELAALAG